MAGLRTAARHARLRRRGAPVPLAMPRKSLLTPERIAEAAERRGLRRLARARALPRRVPGRARRARRRRLRDACCSGRRRGDRGRAAVRPRARRRLPRHDARGRGDPARVCAPPDLVVAADPDAHVFSFQGTSRRAARPVRRGVRRRRARRARRRTHRAPEPVAVEAWVAPHACEEHAAVARELRRLHVEHGVRVARHGGRRPPPGRAPRRPAAGARRRAHPARDARAGPLAHRRAGHASRTCSRCAGSWPTSPPGKTLVEQLLVSDVVGLSPAAARGLLRLAQTSDGLRVANALDVHRGAHARGGRARSSPPARPSTAPRCSPA